MPLARTHTNVEKAELLGTGPAEGPRVLGHAARTWLCPRALPAPGVPLGGKSGPRCRGGWERSASARALPSVRPLRAVAGGSEVTHDTDPLPGGRTRTSGCPWAAHPRREAAGERPEAPSLPDAPLRASPSPACDAPFPAPHRGTSPPLRPADPPAGGGHTAPSRYRGHGAARRGGRDRPGELRAKRQRGKAFN